MINAAEIAGLEGEEVKVERKIEMKDFVRVNITELHGLRFFLPPVVIDSLGWVDGQGMAARRVGRVYMVLEPKIGGLFRLDRWGKHKNSFTVRIGKADFLPEILHEQHPCEHAIQKKKLVVELPDWQKMQAELEAANDEEQGPTDG